MPERRVEGDEGEGQPQIVERAAEVQLGVCRRGIGEELYSILSD